MARALRLLRGGVLVQRSGRDSALPSGGGAAGHALLLGQRRLRLLARGLALARVVIRETPGGIAKNAVRTIEFTHALRSIWPVINIRMIFTGQPTIRGFNYFFFSERVNLQDFVIITTWHS